MTIRREALPPALFGVTIDRVNRLSSIVRALKTIRGRTSLKPIVRVVFDFDKAYFAERRFRSRFSDFEEEANHYKPAIEAISKEAFVMGEIVDSSAVYRCHYAAGSQVYVERTKAYAKVLGGLIDIWEIGNEVNGEWVGWNNDNGQSPWEDPNVTLLQLKLLRERVATEIKDAFEALKTVLPSASTALTFYYNDDGKHHGWTSDQKPNDQGQLVSYGENYSMLKWAEEQKARLPEVDYVLLSYYEDDNEDVTPNRDDMDVAGVVSSFTQLANYFPKKTKFGFGEFAPQCKPCKDRECDECLVDQVSFVNRYYLDLDERVRKTLKDSKSDLKYVGGYFYWYFKQDVVNNENLETVDAFQKALARFNHA